MDEMAKRGVNICVCPCTEGYLADGVPVLDVNDRLCLGTDCNNRIGLFLFFFLLFLYTIFPYPSIDFSNAGRDALDGLLPECEQENTVIRPKSHFIRCEQIRGIAPVWTPAN
jgi:hypothetical protein